MDVDISQNYYWTLESQSLNEVIPAYKGHFKSKSQYELIKNLNINLTCSRDKIKINILSYDHLKRAIIISAITISKIV